MPRVYKPNPAGKRYKKHDPQILRKAVEDYGTSHNVTLNEIGKKYGIPKSVLYRHSTRIMKKHGGQRALSDETELYLIEKINECTDWGYPLDTMSLRYIVKINLDKLGITHKKFKNNYPGPDFVQNFLQRHKNLISPKVYKNIKRLRAKVSPDTIKECLYELQKSLDGVPSSNIINYDKIYLPNNPGRRKVLIKYEGNVPEKILNHRKTSLFIMMAGTADGKMLPPYVVSKTLHLNNLTVQQSPEGTQHNRSTYGWFEGTTIEDWFKNVVIPYCKDISGKKLLIGDNLCSHFSDDLIHDCKEHNINFVFLPSISTYLKQPLNVAFFRQMKQTWRQLLLKWNETDGCQINECLHNLLKLLFDSINVNVSSNIIDGFRRTGICPLNIDQIISRFPNGYLNGDHQRVLDHTLLDQVGVDPTNVTTSEQKRKLHVPVSKSVVTEEIEDSVVTYDKFHTKKPEPIMTTKESKTITLKLKEIKHNNDQVEESKTMDLQQFLANLSEEVYLIIVSTDINEYDD
ncbi:unnamed protein product [Euphydryas editha]|uniref:DDE-1 domain-containing protein n=1 Tax=Euphydryas editha TaxID=104508 RepID=A0AAU9U564_EUPED|nr:unnamed protein product [Euphydryas editha]